MKSRLLSSLALAVTIGGMALILGCGDESKKVGSTAAAPSVTSTAAAAKSTNVLNPAGAPSPAADALPAVTKAPALSPAAEQLVQLAQAGVGDDVLLAYIERFPSDYKLQVSEILYLHDLGLSTPVIAAMVRHDQDSTAGTASATEPASPAATNPPDRSEGPTAASPVGFQPGPVPNPEAETVSLAGEMPQMSGVENPPAQSVTYNYFYNNLASYGNWFEDSDYGWCWQPTVAAINPGWRPYCDSGRWLWSDCGWYWQSSYSWGSIPFHYGRWCYRPTGWAWVPGTVWGPSWVTWCNSGSYCGWAPLPPACGYTAGVGLTFGGGSVGVGFSFGLANNCWTFVPTSYVCNYSPWYYCVPNSRVAVMINNGTIVNNYVKGSGNNVVVNIGPGVEHIAAVSRGEIRRVTLRDANATPGTLVKADHLDRAGRTLTVFRPTLPPQAPAPPQQILARQQEVRRNAETLVKSDVVKLARADTEQRSGTPAGSGTAVGSNARPMPTSRAVEPASITVQSRNEIRTSSLVQQSRPSAPIAAERSVGGGVPNYSSPNNSRVLQPGRGEVRPGPGFGTRSNQPRQGTPAASAPFGQSGSATRTGSAPLAANPPQSFGQPAYSPSRSEARSYGSVPTPAVQARPVTPGFSSAAPTYNPPPRTYAPPPPAAVPPPRSSPPPPTGPRSQPAGSSSPAPRSGSSRNAP